MGNVFKVLDRLKKSNDEKVLKISERDSFSLQTDDREEVQELVIVDLNIEVIPRELCCFTNVTKLDLSKNALEYIDSSITRLTHLRILNLSHNKLSEYPNYMCNFQELSSLDLSCNLLVRLQVELLNLINLKTLKTEGNPTMISPPQDVCVRGKEAIFAELQKREFRRQQNVWKNWKPYYRRDNGINRTLVEICINVILDCDVNYAIMDSVPPIVKNYIRSAEQYDKPPLNLLKCRECLGYFSDEALFDIHICKSGRSISNPIVVSK